MIERKQAAVLTIYILYSEIIGCSIELKLFEARKPLSMYKIHTISTMSCMLILM